MKKIKFFIFYILLFVLFGCSQSNKYKEQTTANIGKSELPVSITDISDNIKQNSFFYKLKNKENVNILIVGDSIGALSWSSYLENHIEDQYNCDVNITNISMGGNSSYAGYVRTCTINNNIDYDLVIVCYGQNDGEEDFIIYYEALIRKIKELYPNSSIICILESSQKEYTNKIKDIQYIAEHYNLLIADTIVPFQSDYDNLTDDGTHPNEKGQIIYFRTIMDIINFCVNTNYCPDNSEKLPLSFNVSKFNKCQYIAVEEFTREDNSFFIPLNEQCSVLGIDYYLFPGNNTYQIFIDDIEYKKNEFNFNYDFNCHYISNLNDCRNSDKITIDYGIKIVFQNKSQADGFKGIILSDY